MRKALALLASLLFANPALAIGTPTHNLIRQFNAGAFEGPGSRGYLPYCQSLVNSYNILKYSNNFSGSAWTSGSGGNGSAPARTSGQADPDGGSNATSVAFPSYTGSSTSYSLMTQTLALGAGADGYSANLPQTYSGWVKGPATTINGNPAAIFAMLTATGTAGSYQRQIIPLDGQWHYFNFVFTGPASGSTFLEIGIDQRDSTGTGNQLTYFGTGTLPAQTVYFYHFMMTPGASPLPYGGDTTTTTVATTITSSCLPGVAYRDWSQVTPYGAPAVGGVQPAYGSNANPISTAENQISAAAQVSGPFLPSVIGPENYSNGTYTAWINCDTTNGAPGQLWNLCLGTATSLGGQWTIGSSGNPVVSWVGYPTAPTGTTWPVSYLLHPALVPGGCNVSGTAYSICMYVGASGSSSSVNSSAIGLYAGSSLSSVSQIGGAGATVVNTTSLGGVNSYWAQFYGGILTDPSLPSILTVNNNGARRNLMIHSVSDNGGKYTLMEQSAYGQATSGAGYAWTPMNVPVVAHGSASWWDNGYNKLDNSLFVDGHGALEYLYTSFAGSYQYIGHCAGSLATSTPGGANYSTNGATVGPFYCLNSTNGLATLSPNFTGGVVPAAGLLNANQPNGTLYGPTNAIGDSVIVRSRGKIYYYLNYGASNRSPGELSIGRDF